MDDEPPKPEYGTDWTVHLIVQEENTIQCSECNRTLYRLPGEDTYHCPCGVDL